MTAQHHVPPPHQSKHTTSTPPPPPSNPLPSTSSLSPSPSSDEQITRFIQKRRPPSSEFSPLFQTQSYRKSYSQVDYLHDGHSSVEVSNGLCSRLYNRVEFMEDDQEDNAFIQRVEQYVNDSSHYDLSHSLTKARHHSLQLQHQQQQHLQQQNVQQQNLQQQNLQQQNLQQQNLQQQPPPPPNYTPPLTPTPSYLKAQKRQTISIMQSVISDETAENPSESSSPSSSLKPSLSPSAPSLSEDVLQAIVDGIGMLKVSRRAAPERRFFRVVVGEVNSNQSPQLVWSKAVDSKAVSSLNMRDVVNIFYGVPSAKLMQTTKIPPVQLAGRVLSLATKQRTLEILADSVEQRKLWVDALTYIHKNLESAVNLLQPLQPTNRAATPQSRSKSPFRFFRSKTPDF